MSITRKDAHFIAVLSPAFKTSYDQVRMHIIKAIGTVEVLSDEEKDKFVFIHDNATKVGTSGYVIEAVNKIRDSIRAFPTGTKRPRSISRRVHKLDIESYGKKSHTHWVDEILADKPDLLLVFDPGDWYPAQYAAREAKRLSVPCDVVETVRESVDSGI